eukprot:scaffold27_cov182-Ochromonas_danica.AAC.6
MEKTEEQKKNKQQILFSFQQRHFLQQSAAADTSISQTIDDAQTITVNCTEDATTNKQIKIVLGQGLDAPFDDCRYGETRVIVDFSSDRVASTYYDKEIAEKVASSALLYNSVTSTHIQATVLEVDFNHFLHVLIEVTTTTTTNQQQQPTAADADDAVEPSALSDFAKAFAQAFYEEGSKQELFDPIKFNGICELELNSQAAQMKFLGVKNGWKPLIAASSLGFVQIVQHVLSDRKVKVNQVDNYERTALHEACLSGHLEVVKLLLSNDQLNPNKQERKGGETPLRFACMGGYLDIVKLLLSDPRVNVNQTNKHGGTALHRACYAGNVELVKLLLADGGVDHFNKGTELGSTPLLIASQQGHIEIVKLLLADNRIDVGKANK